MSEYFRLSDFGPVEFLTREREVGGVEPVPMHNIPTHFDGGDVTDNADGTGPGAWYGAEIGCLTCREVEPMTCGITSTYMLASLECAACGEVFAEYWI